MKLLIFVAAILLAIAGSGVVTAEPEANQPVTDMKSGKLSTLFSFKVRTHQKGDDGTPTTPPKGDAGIEKFVSSCLKSSYNSYHDPTKFQCSNVEVEHEDYAAVPVMTGSQVSQSGPGSQVSQVGPYYDDDMYWNFWTFFWYYWYWFATPDFYFCEGCDTFEDDPFSFEALMRGSSQAGIESASLKSSHPHPRWEERFCACLTTSDDEILRTAHSCTIARSDKIIQDFHSSMVNKPEEGDEEKLTETPTKVTIKLSSNQIADEEKIFMMETLKSFFNILSGSTVAYVSADEHEVAELINYEVKERTDSFLRKGITNRPLRPSAELKKPVVDYIVNISATIGSYGKLKLPNIVGMEHVFCDLIAYGPFAALSTVSDCKVHVFEDDDEIVNEEEKSGDMDHMIDENGVEDFEDEKDVEDEGSKLDQEDNEAKEGKGGINDEAEAEGKNDEVEEGTDEINEAGAGEDDKNVVEDENNIEGGGEENKVFNDVDVMVA